MPSWERIAEGTKVGPVGAPGRAGGGGVRCGERGVVEVVPCMASEACVVVWANQRKRIKPDLEQFRGGLTVGAIRGRPDAWVGKDMRW